jgi:DNA-binding NtrC family response regulator/pSer/pThr/pTyr-binding forkhead associated (FHA) protein
MIKLGAHSPEEEDPSAETSHRLRDAGEAQPLFLRLVEGDQVSSFPLPDSGDVVLGRDREADLRVTNPGISRRHVALRIGSGLAVADVGSANGTKVRGARLEPVKWVGVRVGEVFSIAGVTAVVLPGMPSDRANGVLSSSAFNDVIQSALVAFNRKKVPFGVLTFRSSLAPRWIDLLANLISKNDTVGLFGETEAGVLIVGRKFEDIEAISASLERDLRDRGAFESARLSICPRDGRHEADLFKVKPATGSVDTARPPGQAAHRGAKMAAVYDLVESVAATPTSILILGETGVGKEVLAHEIHKLSDRAQGPFVGMNCAALPENLLESELFGYEKGAFTGAVSSKVGLLETAAGGTVFLDEIGEMPLPTQAKMLRVLQERTVMPVGGLKPRAINVRILSATNRSPRAEIDAGRFRADLYYRLNGLTITIPPLRERLDELPGLVELFAATAAPSLRKRCPLIAPEVMKRFAEYGWPGNIRELRSIVERAVLLCRTGVVTLENLPEEMRGPAPESHETPIDATSRLPSLAGDPPSSRSGTLVTASRLRAAAVMPPAFHGDAEQTMEVSIQEPRTLVGGVTLKDEIEDIERERIQKALFEHGGNQTRAAAALGITRRMLIGRMERYNLPRPRTK